MSDVTLTLTHEEAATLILDRFHDADCVLSGPAVPYFLDRYGVAWTDLTCMERYVAPLCICGYFERLHAAQDKVKLAMVMSP